MGEPLKVRQRKLMSADAPSNSAAMGAAEEVLRTIYGDDFTGCTARVDTIAAIVQTALDDASGQQRALLDLYEQLVEALHRVSTPPDPGRVSGADELRTLLSDRLDAIHALTTKTLQTTALFKQQSATNGADPA